MKNAGTVRFDAERRRRTLSVERCINAGMRGVSRAHDAEHGQHAKNSIRPRR